MKAPKLRILKLLLAELIESELAKGDNVIYRTAKGLLLRMGGEDRIKSTRRLL